MPRAARGGEFSFELYGKYTEFDRALLPRIEDLPNGLHTDLKFQNQAIQCWLLEPRGLKYDIAAGRERAASI